MKSTAVNTNSEEWLRILGKGMVTIPKPWRDELGLKQGRIVKARREGNKVIIESQQEEVSYRVYTAEEIADFAKADKLPGRLKEKIIKKIGKKGV